MARRAHAPIRTPRSMHNAEMNELDWKHPMSRDPLRKNRAENAHDDGHEDIPDAVEDSVATKPGWQGVPVDETDRYRGNDRREHAPKDRHGDIGGEHDRNGWRPDDGEAANR